MKRTLKESESKNGTIKDDMIDYWSECSQRNEKPSYKGFHAYVLKKRGKDTSSITFYKYKKDLEQKGLLTEISPSAKIARGLDNSPSSDLKREWLACPESIQLWYEHLLNNLDEVNLFIPVKTTDIFDKPEVVSKITKDSMEEVQITCDLPLKNNNESIKITIGYFLTNFLQESIVRIKAIRSDGYVLLSDEHKAKWNSVKPAISYFTKTMSEIIKSHLKHKGK